MLILVLSPFSQYCIILLTRDPKVAGSGLLESFLEGVIGCHSDEDKAEFLSAIKDLPSNIHTQKYLELWQAPDDKNGLHPESLQKLNKLLAKHCSENESDSDEDAWETTEEYDGDDGADEDENEENMEADSDNGDFEMISNLSSKLDEIENDLLSSINGSTC